MNDLPTRFLRELIGVFLEASPYILLGFTVAACIQVLLPVSSVRRLFGRGRARSIFAASLLGIPLPLCSCSVLPTALALRRRGAGRGATLSFLVSTPETGIDSIALTYGLMDPLMAIYRPFAALASALAAGFAAEAWGQDGAAEAAAEEGATDAAETPSPEPHPDDRLALEEARRTAGEHARPIPARLREGFRGAFVEIFDETSHWMLAGLVISAVISVLLPAEIVTRYLSAGPVPLLLMLVLGIPLYICASASTPIAAALVLKGLSPGAALVFLLAGPATNIGSLAILGRFLGRRVTILYLAVIAIMSLALGALLDVIYPLFSIDPQGAVARAGEIPTWIAAPAAAVFAGLLFLSFRRKEAPNEFRKLGAAIRWLLGFRITARSLAWVAGAIVAFWAITQFFIVVPPGHRGLIKRFGAPRGEPMGEGLHVKWPPPIETGEVLPVDAVRRIEFGFRSPGQSTGPTDRGPLDAGTSARQLEEEAIYLTGDENLVDAKSVLQYRVVDPVRFLYGFENPEDVLKAQTTAELLDVLAAIRIDRVYTDDRPIVEDRVREGLARRAAEVDLGVEVLHFGIREVHAPPEVHAAFRDVASAQEDKETAVNVALRYLDETVNLARGQAAGDLEEARSFATRELARAKGGSVSLLMRGEAYRERPVGTYTRLYLETVEEVLASARKIIRPGWAGSGAVDLWISSGAGKAVAVEDVLRGSDVRRDEEPESEGVMGR